MYICLVEEVIAPSAVRHHKVHEKHQKDDLKHKKKELQKFKKKLFLTQQFFKCVFRFFPPSIFIVLL